MICGGNVRGFRGIATLCWGLRVTSQSCSARMLMPTMPCVALRALFLSLLTSCVMATPLAAEEPPLGGALPNLFSRGGEDWPRFLGPRGDGTSSLAEITLPWATAGPRIVWHAEMGEGYGAPAVALGRIVLFDRMGNQARLRCLQAETGQQLWSVSDPTDYRDSFGYDGGPRCCPVIAGDSVLTFAADGLLSCRSLADGSLLWQIDTAARYHVVKNFSGWARTAGDRCPQRHLGSSAAGDRADRRQRAWLRTTGSRAT